MLIPDFYKSVLSHKNWRKQKTPFKDRRNIFTFIICAFEALIDLDGLRCLHLQVHSMVIKILVKIPTCLLNFD